MGTYSWEQEVCKAKTFLVQYRQIQYVANETPFFIVIDKKNYLNFVIRLPIDKN
jgi:hypothetical protein